MRDECSLRPQCGNSRVDTRLPIRCVGLSKAFLGFALLLTTGSSGCNPHNDQVATSSGEQSGIAFSSDDPRDDLKLASLAMTQGRIADAEAALKKCLLANPHNLDALELSGDLASRRGDSVAAVSLYQTVIDEVGASADRGLLDKCSASLIRAGRPYDAIGVLRMTCEQFPDDPQPRYGLAGMAAAFGVPEAALPALRWLVLRGQGDPESLLVLADPGRVEPDAESCEKVLSLAGEDRRAEFGLARLDASQQDWSAVAERLESIVSRYPKFVPAYALYGLSLLELGEKEKLVAWSDAAPATAIESSLYWLVLGRWEQDRGRHANAAKAFGQSLRQGGIVHPEVLTLLLASLHQLERHEDVAKLNELIIKQTELRDALKVHLERLDKSQSACMRVADAMLALGRVWEAEAWARMAVSLPSEKIPDLRERYMAVRNHLRERSPWQLPGTDALAILDLKNLPDVSSEDGPASVVATAPIMRGQISFADQALQRGWDHTSIPAPKVGGHSIEQSVGGGIAVIDFDCDGWPDLAAATLDGKALQNDSSPNRLSRNLDGRFVDVSMLAGYEDTGFGQGITVGDYNNDGFADVFDANIGRNRLYRNNGDGTFTDVSDSVGLAEQAWTTSVAMVDLDADSFLDLYEVNYCAGSAPYEHECRNSFGVGTCSPLIFEAEPDQVWRGSEDGTFTEVSDQWMTQASLGRGLGIVAGELDEEPGIDVLVGNDMTVNHLWSSRGKDNPFRLTDIGVGRGIGTSGKSHSQASMGIAVADADGDGDLDLFMTHFADDYNTYYEQVAPGFWRDRSNQLGLSEPSMNLLGFGTQWADFDNHGNLELIVTNGHVDRVNLDDVAYRMPGQLFWRDDIGRWEQWGRAELGDYFTRDHLGRSLVIVDANRDGRCDVAISHLDDPAALLINETRDAGRSIGLQLIAIDSPRDAIGARVTASVGARRFAAQLTAGDGYMSSNERRIHLGCGERKTAEEVTVVWPSGRTEAIGELASGHDYIVVEGSAEAVRVWQHQ